MKTEPELIYCGKATPYTAEKFLESKGLHTRHHLAKPDSDVFNPNSTITVYKVADLMAEFANQSDKEKLIDFFLWFRQNGELYTDKSVEEMIETYLNERT